MRALSGILLLVGASLAGAQDRNVLLVLLDDVGVDRLDCYGLAPDPPRTPTLDRLADEGVRFTRAWAQPYCGPSRAALLTGRYGFRTGIGKNVEHGRGERGLLLDEWTLPEVLHAGGGGAIRTAACGKWHLAGFDQGDDNARAQGFERTSLTSGNIGDYSHFKKAVDGRMVSVDRYATTDTIDDGLALITGFGSDPWFVYLPLHSAHVPFHLPPAELVEREALASDADKHKAAIEAADSELGRLLVGLPKNTVVIVVGDNGTPRPAVEAPFLPEHAKGTLYEGSLHVPLIVAGAGIEGGRVCDALVSTVDLLPTVAALFGIDARGVVPSERALDGHDLSPLLTDPEAIGVRQVLYSERFAPNHAVEKSHLWRAVRGPRFKLIRNELRGRDRLYDLLADPHEEHNLLDEVELSGDARSAYARLGRALAVLLRD